MGKSGSLERAGLANQIQGFGIPDPWDASEKNKMKYLYRFDWWKVVKPVGSEWAFNISNQSGMNIWLVTMETSPMKLWKQQWARIWLSQIVSPRKVSWKAKIYLRFDISYPAYKWMCERTSKRTNQPTNQPTSERTNEWKKNELMNKRINGQVNWTDGRAAAVDWVSE